MKILERIKAKYRLLGHLQSEYKVPAPIIDGAKAKLGADLADELSGRLGSELQQTIDAEIARLTKGELKEGDRVQWPLGNDKLENEVVRVEGSNVVLDYRSSGGMGKGYTIEAAKVTPTALTDLRELSVACGAATERLRGDS